MGSVCGKASSAVKDSEESPGQRELMRKTSELRVARAVSSKRDEALPRVARVVSSKRDEELPMKENLENRGARMGLVDVKVNGSRKVREDLYDKERESCEVVSKLPGIERIPKAVEGEQVAAGWPNWFVAVAGEAIRGWIPRKADTFEKLDKIGAGTYSCVYKGRDLIHNRAVALKKVRFDNMDPESVKFMAREILILRRLDHPNIIKLEGLVASKTSSSLYLVFEYMEHDLTGLASLPGVKFTEPQVKCYMQQLLSGLDYCHSNGVLHRDIKGSNLLIDNHGILKIADFGLASYFDNCQNVTLTSRVVTLWYRPPELLLGATQYGVAVDLWSTGCILGELYAGKPIMPGRTEVEQLHKIFKLCGSPCEDYWKKSKLPHSTVFKPVQPYRCRIPDTFNYLPSAAVRLMKTLLSVDPADRGTAANALESEFFTSNPLPCDPSSLPQYPPSKEIDAKLREEETRRQGAVGAKCLKGENDLKKLKDLRAALAPDPDAQLARSMQERKQGHPNPKSRSEYKTQKEENYSGFPIDPPQCLKETSKDHQQYPADRDFHSGPLTPGLAWTVAGRKHNGTSEVSMRNNSCAASSLEASRPLSSAANEFDSHSQTFANPSRKQDRRRHSQIFSSSHKVENQRARNEEPDMDGHGHDGKNIHFSGPLLAPSHNIELVLKEHERRIQQVARRLRHEKTKAGKIRA